MTRRPRRTSGGRSCDGGEARRSRVTSGDRVVPRDRDMPRAAAHTQDGLPPGPRGLPFSVLALLRDPLGALTDAHAKFGDAATFRLLHLRFVSLADPAAAQHVLVRNHRNYIKSPSYQGLRG